MPTYANHAYLLNKPEPVQVMDLVAVKQLKSRNDGDSGSSDGGVANTATTAERQDEKDPLHRFCIKAIIVLYNKNKIY